jgi:hypothetical protein
MWNAPNFFPLDFFKIFHGSTAVDHDHRAKTSNRMSIGPRTATLQRGEVVFSDRTSPGSKAGRNRLGTRFYPIFGVPSRFRPTRPLVKSKLMTSECVFFYSPPDHVKFDRLALWARPPPGEWRDVFAFSQAPCGVDPYFKLGKFFLLAFILASGHFASIRNSLRRSYVCRSG